MEDLTKHWKSFSLSDREGPGLCLKKEQATSKYAIVARFLTKRPLNIDSIANTFTPLWRTKSGFKVKHIDDRVVLFSFDNKADVDRIIAAEPWSFDKHLLVLTRYDKEAALPASNLTKVAFWVQVYDIPLWFRNKEVAEQICQSVGTILLEVALLDCLMHDDRDYEIWIESEGSLKPEDKQFGPWLRASPFQASRNKVVSVPGFFAKKPPSKPRQPPSDPHSQLQTAIHQVPTIHSANPSGLVNEISENHRIQSCNGTTPPELSEKSTVDLPPNLPNQTDFEELICDIDRDIK
uniref:DUF4283 domain-containing protein n=1 Tax=Quercus lobata TaxID=97700 RepID=A0A7N2REI4_QUELO